MKKLSKVNWIWDYGKVYGELTYEDNTIEYKQNQKPPPTAACHDIAHFICGFNGKLEWDYTHMTNHIAEYNAVFVETLLTNYCYIKYSKSITDINYASERIFNHMKWFSEDYYRIKEYHPTKKNYLELQENFFEKINFDVICNHFKSFYYTWAIEDKLKTKDFRICINMNDLTNTKDEELYNYLSTVKENIKISI